MALSPHYKDCLVEYFANFQKQFENIERFGELCNKTLWSYFVIKTDGSFFVRPLKVILIFYALSPEVRTEGLYTDIYKPSKLLLYFSFKMNYIFRFEV